MRSAHRVFGFVLLAAGFLGATASAQTAPVPAAPSMPAAVGVDMFTATELGAMGRVRATLPVNDRGAVEVFVTLPRREGSSSYGLYGVQGRQRILAASTLRTDVFVTYGAVGPWWSSSHLAVRAEAAATIVWPNGFRPEVGGSIGFSVPFGRR